MNFSVLISIYYTESSTILNRSLTSIWDDQYLKPSQIVLVKDGPLTKDLDCTLEIWKKKLNEIIEIVSIPKNIGLGAALAIGLTHCKYDVVARMDTDDISLPHRFSTQISYLEKNPNIHLLGAHISEFKNDENKLLLTRKVPLNHEDILARAKTINPFNHPSVVYRKSAVQQSGGPVNFTGFDDYFLWVRMLINGCRSHNIDEVLLLMRTGNGLIKRRSGLNYANQEFKFQRMLYKLNFNNSYYYFKNILTRVPVRVFPEGLLKLIYKYILRKK